MSPKATSVIDVCGLTKRYGDRQVLRGVNLQVEPGEVLCLLGPNGAGKTTTIEILEGYRDHDEGTVRVLGFDPREHQEEFRERIGVVLQECGFPKHLRVHELLDAWRGYYSRPRPLAELIELVDLSQHRDVLVRKLSGGQRRRLDFALALAGDPDLIFLDEPTTGFDPGARRRCWAVIDDLRSLGKSILLTTHYLDEAERLADRVAILDGGRIGRLGTVSELAASAGTGPVVSFNWPLGQSRHDIDLPEGFEREPDGRIVGRTPDGLRCIRELSSWAARAGVEQLEHLSIVPPSLEDIYLDLMGEVPEVEEGP